MNRPRIVVVSPADSDTFEWLSDGWNSTVDGTAGTAKAKRLMAKAIKCIKEGQTRGEVMQLMENAGFEVVIDEQA